MPVGALVESASAKRGSDAVADNEERARLRLKAELFSFFCSKTTHMLSTMPDNVLRERLKKTIHGI